MRQHLHHFFRAQSAIAARHCARNFHLAPARLFARERPGQLGIGRVARFHRHEVSANTPANQGEIADEIDDFMPDEFILKTQRLFAQDRVATHHHRIFQAATFD